jgi:uncharacterized protein (DUF3084 family)
MARLDEAVSALEAAAARLDSAVDIRAELTQAVKDDLAQRDRRIATLEAELADLRREHAELQARTDLAAGRLDAAIGRLKSTIGTSLTT